MTKQIELMSDVFVWKRGERLTVERVVPHGGYTDDSHQYVVRHKNEEIHIRSGLVREID
jgi:hypothetical protein